MRSEFIKDCETEYDAFEICPWAAVAIEVDGGYRAYESWTDYEIAINQM